MKTKKQKERRISRNSVNQKKSPSLKLHLLKQHQVSMPIKKMSNEAHQQEINSLKHQEMVADSIKLKKNKEKQKQKLLKSTKVPKKSKYIQISSSKDLLKGKESEIMQSYPEQLYQYQNSNYMNLKRLESSRTFRQYSSHSFLESQSASQKNIVRYEKFEFRSEKYQKLNSEFKEEANSMKFQNSLHSINQQIDDLKKMCKKSSNVLVIMEQIKKKQKIKFEIKKQAYQKKVMELRRKIEEKKINLGHIFSHKEWKNQKLLPEWMILEKDSENTSDGSSISYSKQQIEKKARQIMTYYLQYQADEEDKIQKDRTDIAEDDCLSVNSKG